MTIGWPERFGWIVLVAILLGFGFAKARAEAQKTRLLEQTLEFSRQCAVNLEDRDTTIDECLGVLEWELANNRGRLDGPTSGSPLLGGSDESRVDHTIPR